MAEQDPHELSDALERETDELARESRELEGRVEETHQDWQRKRADESIPGAPPPEGDEESAGDEDSPVEAEKEPPPEARREG